MSGVKPRRWMRLAGVLLTILFLSTALAIIYLPRITGQTIASALERSGFQNVVVEQESVSLGWARFRRISFQHSVEGDPLTANLENMAVHFEILALLRGKLGSVEIKKLTVDWPKQKITPDTVPPRLYLPEISLGKIPLAALSLEHVQWNMAGRIPGNSLTIEKFSANMGLASVKLHFLLSSPLQEESLWKPKNPVALGNEKLNGARLALPRQIPVDLDLKRDMQGKLSAAHLKIPARFSVHANSHPSPRLLSVHLENLEAHWDAKALTAKIPYAESRGKWKGHLSVSLPANSSTANFAYNLEELHFQETPLRDLLEAWPFPKLNIQAGELFWQGTGTLDIARPRNSLSLRQSLSFDKIRANAGDYEIQGFSGACQIAIAARKQVTCNKFGFATGELGISIKNFSSVLDWQFAPQNRVHLDKVELQTMGGKISLQEGADIFLDANENRPAIFIVEGLDLNQVLQVKQGSEFSATGVLDGKIPLIWEGKGLRVKGGEAHARETGVLKYQPGEGAAGVAETNPSLKVALEALRNFHYSELITDVDYAPEGKMELKIRLKGRNPDFQRGQPVHFNINLEENVLALIQSMSIAEDFGKKIDDRVQAGAKAKAKKK